jgi:hypothetical protein
LSAVTYTGGVERAAYDLVPNTWQVLHTSTTNQDDGVLLEIVTDAWDVRRDLDAACKTHARHLAKR